VEPLASLYRFAMRAKEKNLSRGVAANHFVADETVESLISFTDFIIKKKLWN
jgi:hypothetical protein